MTIQEYLKKHKIITDGSFGTYYTKKYETQDIPELANIKYKQRVMDIHRGYIDAGAKLIRTNTFASNTMMLNQDLNEVKENIREAVKLAKQAVEDSGKEVFIAGDIGPILNDGSTDAKQLENQYYEIAQTFMNEGIQILTFETFDDMEHILPVIRKIKKDGFFVMVQFSVNQFGYSSAGLSAKKLLKEAASIEEIDAIGLNCGVGPGHMEQILGRIDLEHDKYMIALPNAGYPKLIRNKIHFADNVEYFVLKEKDLAESGIDIVGGCCGTNPHYIERLAQILDISNEERKPRVSTDEPPKASVKENGFFLNTDGTPKSHKLIAVELAPPVNADDKKLMQAAHILKEAGVDVVTFPDSPSGRTRVDSILMAEKVMLETGLNVMPHICCRDKNAIAMRSQLLGAKINGIHNMLVITGDPIPAMIRQTVKSVFNFDSVGLMKIIKDMNEEIFTDNPISYGGAINQGRRNLDVEIMRVHKKMEAGAKYFFTQPVFTKEEADRLKFIKEETGARIMCGIMPLISRKNALFMKNEIAGITITDEIVNRYPENATKEEGESVGIAIAKEVMAYTGDFVDGYYFSFPFNRVHMLEKIMD